jgi:hypothetical protein
VNPGVDVLTIDDRTKVLPSTTLWSSDIADAVSSIEYSCVPSLMSTPMPHTPGGHCGTPALDAREAGDYFFL